MAEAEESTLIGSVLDGRYRVDRVIGAGGFGTVYEGFHLTLGQRVAIKVFRIADDTKPERRAALTAGFVEEARLLTRLRHDNIVRMLDQGFAQGDGPFSGSPYAVMEFCPHGSLRDLIAERGPLPLAEALALVKQIVAGMRHAHEHGIAHRDLKPGNVMLESRADGTRVPRIIDFGIAKLIEEGDTAGSGATRTRSAVVSFTPAYAAPEQAIGGRTGMWTDVHAIGLIFYELLTGAPPYGDDDLSLKVIDPARPSPAAAGVDAGPFEPVIRRALAIRPDERYPDAAGLAKAIEDAEQPSRDSPPVPAGVGRRALLAGAAVLVTGAAGVMLWRRSLGETTPPAPTDEAVEASAAPIRSEVPVATAAAPSASAAAPASPTLSTLTAAHVVERMLDAGLAPVTRPAPDAAMQQLMVPFRQGDAVGAVYVNAITMLPEDPTAAHAMISL
ncbi:MAG: serine/threonine protein kinase, partial [Myxococcales bacterium]|nr:serine/threonine protein kinase [Myxococcales bacterium]